MTQKTRMSVNTSNILSVIMGGGQGRRLFPLTRDRSKPAVPLKLAIPLELLRRPPLRLNTRSRTELVVLPPM